MLTSEPNRRLLAGPLLDGGAESLPAHLARLGPLPPIGHGTDLIAALEASGLLGRGGAGFPVGSKWRAMAGRRGGNAVVLVNGAEGEPPSAKDRTLMVHRPHLVIDGALLAAEAVGADEIVFYVGVEHEASVEAMTRAIGERRSETSHPMRLVAGPVGYVAGEASAAVHYINAADARPTTTPPRMSERGVSGRPTLVQNVESLAYAALIARFGDDWYRGVGRHEARGTALVTVSGRGGRSSVREIELGITVGEVAVQAGGARSRIGAVLLGGYFGTWAAVEDAWELPLDPTAMKARGLTFGCGIVGLLPVDACGVAATARIMSFMARESAGQCGPCVHGLNAIGDATERLARGIAGQHQVEQVRRWTAQLPGRGACRHPDGAAQLMASAMQVFAEEFAIHARGRRCSVAGPRQGAA